MSDMQSFTLSTKNLNDSIDFWNTFMLWGLALGALAALWIAISTRLIVVRTKQLSAVQDGIDDINRGQIAQLENDNLKLSADLLAAKGDTDKAAAKAANAEKAAEVEKIERLKLEAQIAPRRLSRQQQLDIANFCSPFAGRTVNVVSYALDAEGGILAKQIIDALRASRLNVIDSTASLQPLGGFDMGVRVDGSDPLFAESIRNALSFAGKLVVAPEGQTSKPRVGLSTGTPGQSELMILVGVKPVEP